MWVDSTLKEGQRHLYSRRTFYIDEDSWIAVADDMYDGRATCGATSTPTLQPSMATTLTLPHPTAPTTCCRISTT